MVLSKAFGSGDSSAKQKAALVIEKVWVWEEPVVPCRQREGGQVQAKLGPSHTAGRQCSHVCWEESPPAVFELL